MARQNIRNGHDTLHDDLDSLTLADLAHFVGGADDRRRACDQVMERLRDLVAEIDVHAALYLARRERAY